MVRVIGVQSGCPGGDCRLNIDSATQSPHLTTDCASNPTERTRSHLEGPTVRLNRGNELRPGAFCMPEAAHLSAATCLPVNGRPVFTRALHQVNFLST